MNQTSQNQMILSEEEKSQLKFIQGKRKTFLISATLDKMSATSRMYKNKQFKNKLKQIKQKTQEKALHPKLVDLMSKIKMNFKVEIIQLEKSKNLIPGQIEIFRVKMTTDDKIYYLDYLLRNELSGLIIIFTNSINSVRRLCNILQGLNYQAIPIHSHQQQIQRIKKLEKFSNQK